MLRASLSMLRASPLIIAALKIKMAAACQQWFDFAQLGIGDEKSPGNSKSQGRQADALSAQLLF
jgi:hypothetical protein